MNADTGIPGLRVTPKNDFYGKGSFKNEGGDESY